jgi:fermentation-respiration switch protein FrsA (DUF1100 family)
MLLSRIKLPALVINGRQDPIIPPEVGEMTHDGIKSSKFLLLDDCGHFPFSEQPEKRLKLCWILSEVVDSASSWTVASHRRNRFSLVLRRVGINVSITLRPYICCTFFSSAPR